MEQQDEQKEKRRERTESMTEESFLKDIYFFMKQRDTPIERIPHLGFKQINLYMMFKAVMELGGYHQVTAQQLWKKVYNILGGNPRSTSAATCTRRHYEKLLLPYEYHLAGYGDEIPITLPRQRKRFHPEDEYTEASKRADFTHLHQFNQYLPPGPISLPSYLAVSLPSIPPLSSPVHARPMMPYVPLPSAPPAQKGNVEQSLEYLRHLAQEFKSSSGWTEPLNLSKNQGSLETSRNIPSSFTSPSTKKKEPKFLNEAPRLQQGNQLGISEAPAPAVRNQASRNETDVNNLTSCSSSPNLWKVAPKSPPSSTPSPSPSHRPPPPHHLPHPPPPPPHLLHPHPPPPPHLLPPPPPPPPSHLPPQRPNYPCTVQAKLTTQQSVQVPVSKSGSSTTSPMNPGPTNSTYPSDPYGGMEIQIPLSLLQNLIKEGLILNTASHQHHQPNPKPNETPSVPERTSAETNPDQPADLSLKNQTRNISKSEISINASKSVNGCQAPESKPFSLKLLQNPEIAKLPVYSHTSHLKFPPRAFQEPQMYSKQVPSVPVRSPDQAGFKFPGYGRDAGQIGSINSGMRSEKTTLSPSLDKIKPPSGSLVQLNPEHLKLLFSGSQFRLESGKIC